jgi:hypothetical protein
LKYRVIDPPSPRLITPFFLDFPVAEFSFPIVVFPESGTLICLNATFVSEEIAQPTKQELSP